MNIISGEETSPSVLHPDDQTLQAIRAKVESTSFFAAGGNLLVDSQKETPLVREVESDLRTTGFDLAHMEDLQGIYALAYFDLQGAKALGEFQSGNPLSTPQGRVFRVLDSAIDRIDDRSRGWKSEINMAVEREVNGDYLQTEQDVLTAKSLWGVVKFPKDIPAEVNVQINDAVRLALSTKRTEIAKDPPLYANVILAPRKAA